VTAIASLSRRSRVGEQDPSGVRIVDLRGVTNASKAWLSPAGRTIQQLHRFVGTTAGRKAQYARSLVEGSTSTGYRVRSRRCSIVFRDGWLG
jgi:hypothetical protein